MPQWCLLFSNWRFLLVLLIGILFLAEYSYPNLVSAYPNRSKEFIDNYISLLMAIFIISFIIHFTLQHFRAERETSEDARVQLKASEAQFRLLVENAPDAIFVQTEGRFAYLNDAALRLFGAASADDLLDSRMVQSQKGYSSGACSH